MRFCWKCRSMTLMYTPIIPDCAIITVYTLISDSDFLLFPGLTTALNMNVAEDHLGKLPFVCMEEENLTS